MDDDPVRPLPARPILALLARPLRALFARLRPAPVSHAPFRAERVARLLGGDAWRSAAAASEPRELAVRLGLTAPAGASESAPARRIEAMAVHHLAILCRLAPGAGAIGAVRAERLRVTTLAEIARLARLRDGVPSDYPLRLSRP